jgi:hypothetical protein
MKPMRRLLTALISELALRKSSAGDISEAVYAMLAPLRLQVDRGKMKPALQALDGALFHRLVSADDITHVLLAKVAAGGDRSSEIYQQLFHKLFEWATLPELTQIAGRASSRLWTQLRTQLLNSNSKFNGGVLPLIWINPLVGVLANSQESIPRFKSHVVPELFLASLLDYEILLKSLGFYRLFPGNSEPPSEIKRFDAATCRTLLFSMLDVGKQIGFVSDNGKNCRAL